MSRLRKAAAATIVIACSVAWCNPVHGQRRIEFMGDIRCHERDAVHREIGGVLIIPEVDSTRAVVSDDNGTFSFSLRRDQVDIQRVRRGIGPWTYFFFRGRAGEQADTVIRAQLPILAPLGGFATWHRTETTEFNADIPCASLRRGSALTDAERARIVQRWIDRGLVQLDEVKAGDLLNAGFGSRVGSFLLSGARAGFDVAARAVLGNLAFGFPPSIGGIADSVRFVTDTVRLTMGRESRLLSPALSGLSRNIGFQFAPGPVLEEVPIGNPAGMLLVDRVRLGFQADQRGYRLGSAILRVADRVAVGALFTDFDREARPFCELVDPEALGGLMGPNGCDYIDSDTKALYMSRDFGAAGTQASISGDPLGISLDFSERVVGGAVAYRVVPRLGISVTAKSLHRDVAARPLAVRTTTRSYDGPNVKEDVGMRLIESRLDTDVWEVDVSGLWLLDRTRVGLSLMNVRGTEIGLRDGSRMSARTLGVGVVRDEGRLTAGLDTRFFTRGQPEFAIGAKYRIFDQARIQVGYSGELPAWSVGVTVLGANYTYLDSGPLGRRHLSGFQFQW
ncbi:MAG: hypothetical protein L0271_02990 [Gemmatimonadetes bacterium]|nr:hypothetical protein [Gemmatimonadota bacterium]